MMYLIQRGDPIGPHLSKHPEYSDSTDDEFMCACFCYLCWNGEQTICVEETW